MTTPHRASTTFIAASFRKDVGKRISLVADTFSRRADAAKAAGVSLSTLQAWVHGRSDPSCEGLTRLAAATDTNLNWLLAGVGARTLPSPKPGQASIGPEASLSSDGEAVEEPPTITRPEVARIAIATVIKHLFDRPEAGFEVADEVLELLGEYDKSVCQKR